MWWIETGGDGGGPGYWDEGGVEGRMSQIVVCAGVEK